MRRGGEGTKDLADRHFILCDARNDYCFAGAGAGDLVS